MTAPANDGLIAGRYQLIAPIGSGGTATVYRGLDILLDREVAVKQPTLAPTADADMHAEAVKRTLREARAAARIHHPGVAAVYDVVSGEDSPYIVMQLIKGRPLAELIAEQGPLPPHRVAGVGRQVLAALVAGHVVGVLHRDLKPGNVMITPDGQAVLTDFGIAGTAGDPSITRTGIVLGTPSYMAPERANGMPATPAADLWSLGATLYAALCGQGPFDDRDDALATLFAIANEDPPHLTSDGSLYEIVNALLCRDPADRPAFHEIARALDAAAANAPVTPDPPSAVDLSSATGISAEPDNSPVAEAPSPASPNFGREPDTQPDVAVAPVPAASVPTVSSPVAEPPEAVLAEPWTADDPSGEPWPQDAGLGQSWAPAFVPPSPGANAGHDEGGAVRADRRGRVSLILAAVGGLALVASAVAAFVPGANHFAQSPPAPAQSSPGVARSSPGLAGPPAPPPVGQQFRVAAAANADGSPEVVARARNGTLIAARFTNGSWSAWTTLPGGPAYAWRPRGRGREGRPPDRVRPGGDRAGCRDLADVAGKRVLAGSHTARHDDHPQQSGSSRLARRTPGSIRAPQRRPRRLRVAVFHLRWRHLDWLDLTGWPGHRSARRSARCDRASAGIRRDGRSPACARLLSQRQLGRLGPGSRKVALRRGTRHRHER